MLIILILALCGLLAAYPAHAAPSLLQQTLNAIQGTGSQTLPPPASVELAFSPDGGATDLVIKAIQAAKKSIRVAAYSFTSRPIAAALIEAQKSGVLVQIVIDHEEYNSAIIRSRPIWSKTMSLYAPISSIPSA